MRAFLLVMVLAACGKSAGKAPDAAAAARVPSSFETFATTSPIVGEAAPDFALRDLDGAVVKLSEARGPVVLVSGSFSCPLFRMKAPGFEALARRWRGTAEVYFVYAEEAHPHAASSARLNGFGEQLRGLDADGDRAVTVAEYGTAMPRYMFDAMDVDHDGVVRAPELVAPMRIDQFTDIDAPATDDARLALARRFRAEVPGEIRVLVDPIAGPTARAYGDLPNFAYVIDADRRVTLKLGWAAVADVERELGRVTGKPVPAPGPPDLSAIAAPLAAARAANKPLLLAFTAPGCVACREMETVLTAAPVRDALGGFEVAKFSVETDDAWRLFGELGLVATPAFVRIGADGLPAERREGAQAQDAFLAFLGPPA